MTTTETLLTAEAFWKLPDNDTRRELVDGEVRETMPPDLVHGALAGRLSRYIGNWDEQTNAGGIVGVETGFIVARNPDTVRGPDVFYLAADKVPAAQANKRGFVLLAPDLAVEIVSPDDSKAEIARKVADYLRAGTRLVWVVYPPRREVVAHTADGQTQTQTLRGDETLTAPGVLPGFACPLSRLFA